MRDQRLAELLDRYWEAAYAQGKEGRVTDDNDGHAQTAESAIFRYVTTIRAGSAAFDALMAENERMRAALDEKEVADGLTSNGNLWRFWSTKASALAVRNAELEKRLADAERVIEPFAALPDAPHGKRSYFLELLVRPEGDDPADGVKHYGPAIRAARAYMEGK